jgi:hypothetical protein
MNDGTSTDQRGGLLEIVDDELAADQHSRGPARRPTPRWPVSGAAAARYFPFDQLALSTQCGFASIVFGNPITEADERDKLRLVADVAHETWS